MENGYLLVFDFDGTVANTFQPNPKGVGVYEAYRRAVSDIFGSEGVEIYDKSGGLNNRAPEEIVSQILGENKKLVKLAEACFDQKNKTLKRLVPEGKGAPLEWISGDDKRLQKTIAEMLVLIKLSYLMDEIGTQFPNGEMWPQACSGFLEFTNKIEVLKRDGIDIQFAIISSGHEEFIKKTFTAWEVNLPSIILTDDDMRGRNYPLEFEKRVKPSPYLFDIVHSLWISNGVLFSEYARHIELIRETRQRMLYFGDDRNKDGVLAENAGVPFGLFCDGSILLKNDNSSFVFGDWIKIAEFFEHDKVKALLRNGLSMTKIISLMD